jgi:hypothetical protein
MELKQAEIDHPCRYPNWGLAYALLGLGHAYRNLCNLAGAREAMTQSLSLHRDLGTRSERARPWPPWGAWPWGSFASRRRKA